MKKLTFTIILSIIVVGYLWNFCLAAEVSQGKCIKYDPQQKIIVMEEYDTDFTKEHPYGKPTGITNTYSIENAKIGITPAPGDILRIAYRVKGTERQAIKVMNVTKQDLKSK